MSSRLARRCRAALLEGVEPPCSKVSSRPARSDRAAPLEVVPVNIFQQVLLQVKLERTANRITSVKPIHPVRPARSELHAPPEASYTPRPKRDTRPARREKYTPLGGRRTLRPEGVSPYARRDVSASPNSASVNIFHQVCLRQTWSEQKTKLYL